VISLKPHISVVIVNYNGARFLRDCLDSLHSQTRQDYEIILVDNCSTDRSIEIITHDYPGITLIRNSTNRGFAAASNQGIRVARGDYILSLNNDTRLSPRFLDEIIHPMEDDPRVGICASKMLYPDGRINSAGTCISRSGAAWDRGMSEPDRCQYDSIEEVFGACAGAALYRREMLDEIGLFDEDFFMYMEDVDLSFGRGLPAGHACTSRALSSLIIMAERLAWDLTLQSITETGTSSGWRSRIFLPGFSSPRSHGSSGGR